MCLSGMDEEDRREGKENSNKKGQISREEKDKIRHDIEKIALDLCDKDCNCQNAEDSE